MDAQQIGILIGTVILVIITGIVSFITGKKNNNDADTSYITQKDLSDCTDKIYGDMDERIEKATKELATKESVSHISEGLKDLGKKFDEFGSKLTQMMIDVAVIAERRSQPRDK